MLRLSGLTATRSRLPLPSRPPRTPASAGKRRRPRPDLRRRTGNANVEIPDVKVCVSRARVSFLLPTQVNNRKAERAGPTGQQRGRWRDQVQAEVEERPGHPVRESLQSHMHGENGDRVSPSHGPAAPRGQHLLTHCPPGHPKGPAVSWEPPVSRISLGQGRPGGGWLSDISGAFICIMY